ncbi:DUF2786 domain-containing protein [Rhodococcus kronopolitis]|uniref:DUF2786 domain-containing protein n=1 Tax=Rhodococcus kronopolitis TaxID=1460226 RepID=A0ABV9FTU4_9NOCA
MKSNRTDIRGLIGCLSTLSQAYERGWQPADVLHVTRRSLPATLLTPAAVLILHESRRSDAWSRAPRPWLDQLRTIAETHPGADAATEIDESQAQVVARFWWGLHAWTALCPPPSAWPPHRDTAEHRPDSEATAADTKVLNKIRGLLAKAESTQFVEEAETLTAKAQELMTRYAIDAAVLEAAAPGATVTVDSRRVHLDSPYVKQKALLLSAIGEANHVAAVITERTATVTMVGAPVDVRQSEMLFTSLLVQATRAMQVEGDKGSRSTEFRKAFLFGFAVRIGQRLTEAGKAGTAQAVADSQIEFADLLPILAAREVAVRAEVTRIFGRTKTMRGSATDASGLRAGRSAADAATLGTGSGAIAG